MKRKAFWGLMCCLWCMVGQTATLAPTFALANTSPAKPKLNEAALNRIKHLPSPVQSASGEIFVRCLSADRAALRWPIMRFAENVSKQLADTFLPLGSSKSPLTLEIGTQTNAVTSVERRIFRADDGFCQLIIRIPNPDTVELECLREAVGEALLREKTRDVAGSYTAFKWDLWWLKAVLDAAQGSVWRAEAYDRFSTEINQKGAPTLQQIFSTPDAVSRETKAFLAIWLLEDGAYKSAARRLELLTKPWSSEALLSSLSEEAWQEWLNNLNTVVFLPGTMFYEHFKRWKAALTEPKDASDAIRISKMISREMIGRPRIFSDLSSLYLNAYVAYLNDGVNAYRIKRKEADEAAKALEQYFKQHGILTPNTNL